jgi:outer membrane protein assembly factor BamB
MNRFFLTRVLAIVGCLVLGACTVAAEPSTNSSEASNWSQFRGPIGLGISEAEDLPVSFDAKNVAWKTDLPVEGHSSPVVWGDRIFVTGAKKSGKQAERHVLCLDRNNGSLLWDSVAGSNEAESLHKMNSWATPSCVTDGQRVIAFFGSGGLHCFDNEGKKLWSNDLGAFPGGWGVGASPILFESNVIQNCDAEGESFLVALNKETGAEVWRTPREAKPRGGWSTPIVIEVDGHQELVVNGEFGVNAYDPSTGEPLWNCKGFNGRGTPVPAWGHGRLYVVNGKTGDIYSVKPGGKGDVTETHRVWHTDRRGGRDLPSPVLSGNCVVAISMSGIATGYDSETGKELWKERLGGNFSGSPITAGGLVYALAENGEVVVFEVGEKLKIVARNTFAGDDEMFRSSPAVSGEHLLVRGARTLFSIRN